MHCGPPSRALAAVISLSVPLELAAGVDGGAPVTRFSSVAGGLMRRFAALDELLLRAVGPGARGRRAPRERPEVVRTVIQ
ncbi:AraC family transcriptional regulator [Streptomyces sp. W007]|nr:AraC family transcriptional regulator [Streptomyces sp. W007]